jgi:DNA-binding HxlR family transcriptional regulator
MTTQSDEYDCPAEALLKQLSGKWKPQLLRIASEEALRFNKLLKLLPGSTKQAIAVALKDLEEAGLLKREVIRQKPLHVEYYLTEKGKATIPLLSNLSEIAAKG